MANTDLTFITNEAQQNLKTRFQVLIKDTKLFDCLAGYFYTSGFYAIYKSLKNTEKIRILIGISTNKQTYDLLTKVKENPQQSMQFSHAETKQEYSGLVEKEMEDSEDKALVERPIGAFLFYSRLCKLISLQILEGRHPISSGKKKAVQVLINIRILKFIQISVRHVIISYRL